MKFVLLVFAFFLTSCSGSNYKQPMLVSTKVSAVPNYKSLGKVEANGCNTSSMFGGAPVDFRKMQERILDDAISKGGDAVVDFQVKSTSSFSITFFFYRYCYSVSGTAVKFKSEGSAWDASPLETKEQETKSIWD